MRYFVTNKRQAHRQQHYCPSLCLVAGEQHVLNLSGIIKIYFIFILDTGKLILSERATPKELQIN